MLRIPVCKHNVEGKSIFRVSAWVTSSMDAESADYRTCLTYGALYKQQKILSYFEWILFR